MKAPAHAKVLRPFSAAVADDLVGYFSTASPAASQPAMPAGMMNTFV